MSMRPGHWYHLGLTDMDLYFYAVADQKNGGMAGIQFDVDPARRKRAKGKKKSIDRLSATRTDLPGHWRELDPANLPEQVERTELPSPERLEGSGNRAGSRSKRINLGFVVVDIGTREFLSEVFARQEPARAAAKKLYEAGRNVGVHTIQAHVPKEWKRGDSLEGYVSPEILARIQANQTNAGTAHSVTVHVRVQRNRIDPSYFDATARAGRARSGFALGKSAQEAIAIALHQLADRIVER